MNANWGMIPTLCLAGRGWPCTFWGSSEQLSSSKEFQMRYALPIPVLAIAFAFLLSGHVASG